MDTLRSYEESEPRLPAARKWIGAGLTALGFTLLTNAFLVFLPFGHLLSLRAEILLSGLSGVVGAAGLWLSGRTGKGLVEPILLLTGGIIAKIAVTFVGDRFGILGLIALVVVAGWCANKIVSRVD